MGKIDLLTVREIEGKIKNFSKGLYADKKSISLNDGKGLMLKIEPLANRWLFRFKFEGKDFLKSIGTYPELTLQQARQKRKELLAIIAEGKNPTSLKVEAKKESELEFAGQFHILVREWVDSLTCSQSHKAKKYRAFERDLFPYFANYDKNHLLIGSRHIKTITHDELLKAVKNKALTAQDTANRILTDCRGLWQYALENGHIQELALNRISKKAVPKPAAKHYPKIVDEVILSELLNTIDNYKGFLPVKVSLQVAPYLMLRASNLVNLKWSQIDFDKAVITIPRENMKLKDKNLSDFVLPISKTPLKLLKDLKSSIYGGFEYCFINQDLKEPINEETPNRVLQRMGFNDEARGRKQRLHSFRGTFSSLIETHLLKHGLPLQYRENLLDHKTSGQVEGAYSNKANNLEGMKLMIKWWDDYLDGVKRK